VGAKNSGTGMELLVIVDTDIFIDHFRGKKEATEYLGSISPLFRATTDINLMELFAGAKNLIELRDIEQFLSNNFFDIMAITRHASRLAVDLYKNINSQMG
jgi:predicted nucleic acid-binding protein